MVFGRGGGGGRGRRRVAPGRKCACNCIHYRPQTQRGKLNFTRFHNFTRGDADACQAVFVTIGVRVGERACVRAWRQWRGVFAEVCVCTQYPICVMVQFTMPNVRACVYFMYLMGVQTE